jgi:hypothetical protein
MNSKEVKTILNTYKQSLLYYKLTDYTSEVEKERINGMIAIMKVLNIDYTLATNEITFDNNQYLLNTWKEICEFISIDTYKTCNENNIEWIKQEIQFTSENERQYSARLERVNNFINTLNKKDIILKAA